MLVRTIADYGGAYVDARVVKNPQCEMAASKGNRLLEDVAQLTATGFRAMVRFTTTATVAPVAYAAASVTYRSFWGSGDSVKPAVAKTGTGLYTVTFASSYNDGLLIEAETVALEAAHCTLQGSTLAPPPQVTALSSTVVSLTVMTSAFAASDLSGAAIVTVWVR